MSDYILSTCQRDDLTTDRLAGFDALRVFGTALVIVLHAAVPYLVHPLPGLVWPVNQEAAGLFADRVFWWIETFIMPLFFVISGYFAARVYALRGADGFLRHRTNRLLLPFVFACICVLPFDLYVWVFGWVVEGRYGFRKLQSLKFEDAVAADLWGFSHLWFLQYLFLYCLIFWAAGRTSAYLRRKSIANETHCRSQRQGIWGYLASGFSRFPYLTVMPCSVFLFFAPEIVMGFQHGFWPYAPKFVYEACYFFAGVALFCDDGSLPRLGRWSGAALVITIPAYALLRSLMEGHFAGVLPLPAQVVFAVTTASVAALSTFGLLGLFARLCARPNGSMRYLATASFWAYLVHHPFVGFVHISLRPLPCSATLKFLLAAMLTMTFCLSTYHVCVRSTWIGRLLNGSGLARTVSSGVESSKATTNDRRVAA